MEFCRLAVQHSTRASASFTYLDFASWSHRWRAFPLSPLPQDVRDITRRHLIHGDELCPLEASFRLVEHNDGIDGLSDPTTHNTDEKLAMQTDSLYLRRSDLPALQTAVDTCSSNVESPTPSTHSDERRHTIGRFYPSSIAGRGQADLLFRAIAAEAKPPEAASTSQPSEAITCDSPDSDFESTCCLDIEEIDPTLFGREQYADMGDGSPGWAEYVRRMLEEGKPENVHKRMTGRGEIRV